MSSTPNPLQKYTYYISNLGECIDLHSFWDMEVVFVTQTSAYPIRI